MIIRTLAFTAALFATFSGFALEVGDLHLPMKRSDADNTLTKDYSFEILTDGTIRRTWHITKRTVTVDFDPADDTAICIAITYNSPVSRKTAEEDADAMAPASDAKWKKTKPEAVEKVGIPVGSSIKEFEDKSMIFLEAAAGKHKYGAVTYFSKAPHKNRKELEAVSADQNTAMGATSMAGDIRFLIKDEQARQSAAGGAVASTGSSMGAEADSLTAEPTVTVTVTPKNNAKPAAASQPAPAQNTAAVPTGARGEKVTIVRPLTDEPAEAPGTVSTAFTKFDGADDDKEYGNLLDVVKAKTTPAQLCIAAIIIIVLVFLIAGSAARSRAKKRQKANFAQVIISSPTSKAKVPMPAKARKPVKRR